MNRLKFLTTSILAAGALLFGSANLQAAPRGGGAGAPHASYRGGGYYNGGGYRGGYYHGGRYWHGRWYPGVYFGYYPYWDYPYWDGGYYGYYPYGYGYYPYGGVYQGRAVGEANGNVAVDVQRQLAREGFYHGRADGVIGDGTRRAIRAYERAHNLRVTGQINGRLLSTMDLG